MILCADKMNYKKKLRRQIFSAFLLLSNNAKKIALLLLKL